MTLFSAKSIGLYSLAIGSAIVFFNVVTSYGEATLKAPMPVDGNYLITAQNLPTCLQQQRLTLNIQQSGMYLNASLTTDRLASNSIGNPRPTFSGRFHDRQVDLSGLIPTNICPQGSQLQISGSIVEITPTATKEPIKSSSNRQLQGQIRASERDNQQGRSIPFIGILQPATRSTSSH
jgi:hypothetical protein